MEENRPRLIAAMMRDGGKTISEADPEISEAIDFVRFYSLASNGIKSGYLKINYSIDESAYLLGYSKFKTFTNI